MTRSLSPLLLALLFLFEVAPTQAQSIYERYPFATLAGKAGGFGTADGMGKNARFYHPVGIAVDGGGNLYVADSDNHAIRKITPAGTVTTFAGRARSPGSVDGTGSDARFYRPAGVAVDSAGNVYVGDSYNHTIRKITPTGSVTTLAGASVPGDSGEPAGDYADGTGSAARFNLPWGVAVDSGGSVYVAEWGNNVIRKITPDGVVTTMAGTANAPGSADGLGSDARFNLPSSVAVDGTGNVFVADTSNSTIRKIAPNGFVSTWAGSAGNVGSADGNRMAARFDSPAGVAVDAAGVVFVTDGKNNTVRKISTGGVVTTWAGAIVLNQYGYNTGGHADGQGSAARFSFVYAANIPVPFRISTARSGGGVAAGTGGYLYVADSANHVIRKISPSAVVETIAGAPPNWGNADGAGSVARFLGPQGITLDQAGNIYLADIGNHAIRKVTPAGVVSTLAATGLAGPRSVAVDPAGNFYVVNSSNDTISKVAPDGAVSTFAGAPNQPGYADGPGNAARFSFSYYTGEFVFPYGPVQARLGGVAVDSAGVLYVADTANNKIRKITPAGEVTTFVSSLWLPHDVAVDSAGNLYVTCSRDSAVRKVSPAGVVSILAGSPSEPGSVDGPSSTARFSPGNLTLDAAGNVYVTDGAHTIRKITPSGFVTTLAGLAGVSGSADGTGSDARFTVPRGIAVASNGYVYVADSGNNTIRVGGPSAASQLSNISTREQVMTGSNVLIGGFIVKGSVPKNLIIRAIGPSLGSFGVEGFLADPVLELRDASGNLVTVNDDWKINDQTHQSQEAAVRATTIPPVHDKDAAILATLSPNQNFTAIVRGKGDGTGVAVLETYDLNQSADSLLANISTRGLVGTGNNVMIGGFILGGANGSSRVAVRALGPSLTQAGLAGALTDPTLELCNGNGAIIAANDNWKTRSDGTSQQGEVEATTIPPAHDLESTIVATLSPGPYTAIVAGRGGVTGVGLVEIYDLQ